MLFLYTLFIDPRVLLHLLTMVTTNSHPQLNQRWHSLCVWCCVSDGQGQHYCEFCLMFLGAYYVSELCCLSSLTLHFPSQPGLFFVFHAQNTLTKSVVHELSSFLCCRTITMPKRSASKAVQRKRLKLEAYRQGISFSQLKQTLKTNGVVHANVGH